MKTSIFTRQYTLTFALMSCLCLAITNITLGQNTNNGQGSSLWKTNGNNINTGQFIGTINNRDVIFRSNNIERLRITPEGNVGIGTNSPLTKLDVNGNVTLRNSVYLPGLDQNNGLSSFIFYDPDSGELKKGDADDIGNILYEGKPCIEGDILNPYWANGTNKIYIPCPQVDVGIGTPSPNHRLDVHGFIGTTKGIRLGNDYTPISGQTAYIEGFDYLPHKQAES